jgi:endonuclease/exonuclease/phosphatase (EEP) superfamily protein YafD
MSSVNVIQQDRPGAHAGSEVAEIEPPDFTQSARPRWLPSLAAAMFLIGLAIRLTVGDRLLVASTIYYATPWSILAALAFIKAWYERRRIIPFRAWLAASGICGLLWLSGSLYSRTQTATGPTVRVIQWNMAHGNRGLPGLVDRLAELDPDIAILIEADPQRLDVRAVFEGAFPDRHVTMMGGGIALVSRWPAGESIPFHVGYAANDARIREIDVQTPYGPWTVFAVDLDSNPFYLREKAIRELAELVDRRNDRPVIVAGDFNTPLDSAFYDDFRALGLQEIFQSAGTGYLHTWPVPLPVLSLDQVWVNARLKPISCERKWAWRSDHAAVIGTVAPQKTD